MFVVCSRRIEWRERGGVSINRCRGNQEADCRGITGYHSYPPISRLALQSITLPAYLWPTLIFLLQPVRACPNNQYKYNVPCLSQPYRLK